MAGLTFRTAPKAAALEPRRSVGLTAAHHTFDLDSTFGAVLSTVARVSTRRCTMWRSTGAYSLSQRLSAAIFPKTTIAGSRLPIAVVTDLSSAGSINITEPPFLTRRRQTQYLKREPEAPFFVSDCTMTSFSKSDSGQNSLTRSRHGAQPDTEYYFFFLCYRHLDSARRQATSFDRCYYCVAVAAIWPPPSESSDLPIVSLIIACAASVLLGASCYCQLCVTFIGIP